MNLKNLAQKIALTALAAISANTDNLLADNSKEINNFLGNPMEDKFKISKKKPVLLLKKPAVDIDRHEENPLSHRSHRSHSSHRSHYSSSSGSSSGSSRSYTPPAKTYTTPSTKPNNIYTPPAKKTYSLGSRFLKRYMEGEDIKELNSLLVKKGYLRKGYEYSEKFSESTESAIKKIQRQNNISVSGEVNSLTLLYVQSADKMTKENTTTNNNNSYLFTPSKTYELGDRTLKVGLQGNDVAELRKELSSLGYLRDDSGGDVFDYFTKEAVKAFQKANGLGIDGIVGRNTIRYIQNKYIASASVYSGKSDSKTGAVYYVKESTSLRHKASSNSAVLDRLGTGDKVTVIDSVSEQYWWKVSHDNIEGWVKSHLLQK